MERTKHFNESLSIDKIMCEYSQSQIAQSGMKKMRDLVNLETKRERALAGDTTLLHTNYPSFNE